MTWRERGSVNTTHTYLVGVPATSANWMVGWKPQCRLPHTGVNLGVVQHLLYFYFFLPLVPVGIAGRYSCVSAARRVAWRRDIPWVLRVSATESIHRFLGLPLALQLEYLVLYARRAGWLWAYVWCVRTTWPVVVWCAVGLVLLLPCLVSPHFWFYPAWSCLLLVSSISFHKWPVFSRGLLLVTMSGTGMLALVGKWHWWVSP